MFSKSHKKSPGDKKEQIEHLGQNTSSGTKSLHPSQIVSTPEVKTQQERANLEIEEKRANNETLTPGRQMDLARRLSQQSLKSSFHHSSDNVITDETITEPREDRTTDSDASIPKDNQKLKDEYRQIKQKIEADWPRMLALRTPTESSNLTLEYKHLRNQKSEFREDPPEYINKLKSLQESMFDQNSVNYHEGETEPLKILDAQDLHSSRHKDYLKVLSKLEDLPETGLGNLNESKKDLIDKYKLIVKKIDRTVHKSMGIAIMGGVTFGSAMLFMGKKHENLLRSGAFYHYWIKNLDRQLDYVIQTKESLMNDFATVFPDAAKRIRNSPPAMQLIQEVAIADAKLGGDTSMSVARTEAIWHERKNASENSQGLHAYDKDIENLGLWFQVRQSRDLAQRSSMLRTALQESHGDGYLQFLRNPEVGVEDPQEFDKAIQAVEDNAKTSIAPNQTDQHRRSQDVQQLGEQFDRDHRQLSKLYDKLLKAQRSALEALLKDIQSETLFVEQPASPREVTAKIRDIQNVLRRGEGKKYDSEMANRLEAIAQRAGITKLSLWATIRVANVCTDEHLPQENADLSLLMKRVSPFIEQWKKEEPVWKAIAQTNKYLDKFEAYKKINKHLLQEGLDQSNMTEQFDKILESAITNVRSAQDYLGINEHDSKRQKELLTLLDSINKGFEIIESKMPERLKKEIQEKKSEGAKPQGLTDQMNTMSSGGKDMSVWNDFELIGGDAEIEQKEAKIICLGENHTDERHLALLAKLINTFDDDSILLNEETPAMMKLAQEINPVAKSVSRRVSVFGWDNTVLHTIGLVIVVGQRKIISLRDSLIDVIPNEDVIKDSWNQILRIEDKINNISKERNKSLLKTLKDIKEKYPDKRVFVIAGSNHFQDPIVIKTLKEYKGIALKPLRTIAKEIPRKEYTKKGRQYYDESTIVAYLRMMALSNM